MVHFIKRHNNTLNDLTFGASCLWFCRESNVQVDSMVTEVLGQMLQEVSSSEIQLEQDRVAEEKRKLEEARWVY